VLSSFGREFAMNTFALLLAQPLERNRLWWMKTGVLACAIASAYYAWVLSWTARSVEIEYHPFLRGSSDWFEMLLSGGFGAVAIFAGGLLATLLLRQVAAAFWFTVFLPLAIEAVLQGTPAWLNGTILVASSAAAFLWARWLFYRAQEVGWTGGTVALPGWRSEDVARPGNRSRRPLSALFWKEVQLHQVGLAGMAGLFVLHLGVVALRKYGGNFLGDTFKTGLDVFGGMWFLVPLLIGGTSVAEERKLGTLQAHLTLPVSRKVQFMMKLLMVLLIGGLLSAILLWTAEGIASALGVGCGVEALKIPFNPVALFTLGWIFLGWSLVCFLASTLVGGLIQSFAASVLAAAALWLVLTLVRWLKWYLYRTSGFVLWEGEFLLFLIAVPALVSTVVSLSYRNFKIVSESWRLWRRNLLTFAWVLTGIVVTASAIYNRVWELATPLEPAHGPARIAGTSPPVMKFLGSDPLNLLMPDGRILVNRVDFDEGRSWLGFQTGQKWTPQTGNHFLSGSNWTDALSTRWETVAIRGDGTLWVSEKPGRTWHFENKKRVYQWLEPSPLVQYGTETNWQSVVQEGWGGAPVFLLKKDGTLWRWSPTAAQDKEAEAKPRPWPGLRAFAPRRLGTGTNWNRIIVTRITGIGMGIYAWKDDGECWVIFQTSKTNQPLENELEPGMVMGRYTNLDGFKFKSLTTGWTFQAGLAEDGSLWAWVGQTNPPVRLGKDNDWTSLAGDNGRFMARKADGSLWQWYLDNHTWTDRYSELLAIEALQDLAKTAPTRVGDHDDWLAVADHEWPQGIVALAADGSLWHWWDRDFLYEGYSYPGHNMRPPRKPSFIANIFDNRK